MKVELQLGTASVRVEGELLEVERILATYWKPAENTSAQPNGERATGGAGTLAEPIDGPLTPRSGSRSRKSKPAPKLLKDLVLDAHGKFAKAFAEAKAPTSSPEKSTVAVFYLLREIDIGPVSADHVYTFFKYVGWPLPANPMNSLHKASSEGWLDTKNSSDIKLAPIGENLVEHDLPRSKAKAAA